MGDTWHGIVQGRTLGAEACFVMPSGRIRGVALTKRQLLGVIRDAAAALAKIEEAEAFNRAREDAIREAYEAFGGDAAKDSDA